MAENPQHKTSPFLIALAWAIVGVRSSNAATDRPIGRIAQPPCVFRKKPVRDCAPAIMKLPS